MDGAQLVFLDPDNGLETTSPNHKSVLFSELKSLRSPSRALLFLPTPDTAQGWCALGIQSHPQSP